MRASVFSGSHTAVPAGSACPPRTERRVQGRVDAGQLVERYAVPPGDLDRRHAPLQHDPVIAQRLLPLDALREDLDGSEAISRAARNSA